MPHSLLMCFAHPDDESFFAAGTAHKYAAAGVNVVLCCGTRGERGGVGDPPLATIETLPQVRERELRAAATIIGVSELVLLDYQDQQLANAPSDAMREHIGGLIRRHRPNVVITFDPNGGNRHTDHIAISRFTSDAVQCAADARWRPDLGPAHRVRRLVWTGGIDAMQEPDLATLREYPGVDFMIDITASREIKARALLAHATQREGVNRVFLERPDRDAMLSREVFRVGMGEMPPASPADDLYTGLS